MLFHSTTPFTENPFDQGSQPTTLGPEGEEKGVAFVGSYPPRQCGIATFTHDLRTSLVGQDFTTLYPVVAVSTAQHAFRYPSEVWTEFVAGDAHSAIYAANLINQCSVRGVSLQHEFGLFGGPAGAQVLDFVRALRKPLVTTFHTVLRHPNEDQLLVMRALVKASERVVTMTKQGVDFLVDIYQTPIQKIDLIPHGIPDSPPSDSLLSKERLGLSDCQVLLTFGFISPNKGIEDVVEALPPLIAEFPRLRYLVVGKTHPNCVREQGEIYRETLTARVKELGLTDHVVFVDQYVASEDLHHFISAADVYITPYHNLEQITSGTLAIAFGMGKPVISTPYWHARELLGQGGGILVPFRDPPAIQKALRLLLLSPQARVDLGNKALAQGMDMGWKKSAEKYARTFQSAFSFFNASAAILPGPHELRTADPKIEIHPAHILRMTDETGILQHANHSIPARSHGYCTDDNARALILALAWSEGPEPVPITARLIPIYVAFLLHAFHPTTRRFRNFMNYDRSWRIDEGSEDCHGRAVWALGVCIAQTSETSLRLAAKSLFLSALHVVPDLTHPRAWAYVLLGLTPYLEKFPLDHEVAAVRLVLLERLKYCFSRHAREDWLWMADNATYDNARLPEALILSGQASGDPVYGQIGLQALGWLIRIQQSTTGHFQPIGSDGFCHRNGTHALFDQQPVEVSATVSACIAAWTTTDDSTWLRHAERVYSWFHGNNDLHTSLVDAETSGCYDGLHADRTNGNQGAESTLAYHLATHELQRSQRREQVFLRHRTAPVLHE